MRTATSRRNSAHINAGAAGVILSLGALAALVYQGLTDAGDGPMQVSIPVLLSTAALCAGVVLLIATAFAKPPL
jgi:hypothetical protein